MKIETALEPFTWDAYRLCLSTALGSGYNFVNFATCKEDSPLPEGPIVLLRHDIDYDPDRALPISTLETEQGIQATYFFQANSRFYNLEDLSTVKVIRDLLRQNHWLGLHFDANEIEDDEAIVERVERAACNLETTFETSIDAVSFHMPGYRKINHLRLKKGRINTYGPLFFTQIEYVSDSNQNWRGKDILRIFQERQFPRIQLLTHPIWWQEVYKPLYVKIEELAAKLGLAIDDILTDDQRALCVDERLANKKGSRLANRTQSG